MTYRTMLVALSVALSLLTAPMVATDASAQSYEEGLVAFDRGDFATAARIWEPLAVGGNARAQHGLGMLYESGQGVSAQNYERAAMLYGLAARQGVTAAANNLALMYSDGRGVPQDFAEAYRLWKSAADQGHPMAQFNLGLMFFRGQGLPAPDYNEAAWWFGQAAESGSVDAQFAMGELNARGLGLPQNLGEAERWYRIAAGSGHPMAKTRLEELQAGTLQTTAPPPTEDGSASPFDAPPPADPALADLPTEEAPPADPAETEAPPAEATGNEPVDQDDQALVPPIEESPAEEAAVEEVVEVEEEPVPQLDSGVLIPPPVLPESAQPVPAPPAVDSSAASQTAAAPVESVAPAAPAPAAPVEMPAGVFVLLGNEPTPVAAEQRWSILKVAFPAILGGLSPLMTPADDGGQLIFGGPLASPDEGAAICAQLQKRDGSVSCQVVTN